MVCFYICLSLIACCQYGLGLKLLPVSGSRLRKTQKINAARRAYFTSNRASRAPKPRETALKLNAATQILGVEGVSAAATSNSARFPSPSDWHLLRRRDIIKEHPDVLSLAGPDKRTFPALVAVNAMQLAMSYLVGSSDMEWQAVVTTGKNNLNLLYTVSILCNNIISIAYNHHTDMYSFPFQILSNRYSCRRNIVSLAIFFAS